MLLLAVLAALVTAGAGGRELLPNLVELPPSDVQIETVGERYYLRFTSTAANRGSGPLVIVSKRAKPAAPFVSFQDVSLAGGGVRRHLVDVSVRYRTAPGHDHFHVADFERYELRTAAGRVVLTDHKAGFCLGDRRPVGGASTSSPARFTGNCGRGVPDALRLVQGISRGWSDPYRAELDGQELDVTNLPGGIYQLVNRVNPTGAFHEAHYGDNAAAAKIALAWPVDRSGPPTVQVLGVCIGERC